MTRIGLHDKSKNAGRAGLPAVNGLPCFFLEETKGDTMESNGNSAAANKGAMQSGSLAMFPMLMSMRRRAKRLSTGMPDCLIEHRS